MIFKEKIYDDENIFVEHGISILSSNVFNAPTLENSIKPTGIPNKDIVSYNGLYKPQWGFTGPLGSVSYVYFTLFRMNKFLPNISMAMSSQFQSENSTVALEAFEFFPFVIPYESFNCLGSSAIVIPPCFERFDQISYDELKKFSFGIYTGRNFVLPYQFLTFVDPSVFCFGFAGRSFFSISANPQPINFQSLNYQIQYSNKR